MTQKVFDTENADDMALLWDILPNSCRQITVGKMWDCIWEDDERFSFRSLFKINWHDKTEITRPVNYEDMMGCVGFFGSKGYENIISILKGVDIDYPEPWFRDADDSHWESFRPAKKSELKFYEDKQDD